MIAELQQEEARGELLFRSVARRSPTEKVLACLCYGLFFGTCTHQFLALVPKVRPVVPSLLVGLFGATVGAWYVHRPQHSTLRATNLEFYLSSVPSVPRANIRYLEYRDAGGGENSQPCGLYAVLDYSSRCLLPHLNANQTGEVIDAIYKRFPDMAAASRTLSPGGHFTLLGL